MSDMRKAALYYATKLKWPVFPVWPVRDGKCGCGDSKCNSPGKHPVASIDGKEVAPRGVLDATTRLVTVERWWTMIPDANIGCRGTRWFALDVDDMDALYELEEGYGPLPHTPMSFTGSGGRHYFFKQPNPPLGNTEGNLPYGINVRGHTGYVILAPSNHIRGSYEWELSSKPTDIELAEPPAWMLEMIGSESKAPDVVFESHADIPDLGKLKISGVIKREILNAPADGDDRSAISQRVITALADAGCTDTQIREIFMAYPVGTQSKYADKGDKADAWLAQSIGNARAWLRTHKSSKAIPGKIITPAEAKIEDSVLREVYKKGWHDALTNKMELLKMWPDYLGLDDQRMAPTMVNLYDIGLRTDYIIGDSEFPALAVPLPDLDGKVTNVDYSIYGGSMSRAWESSNAPVFIADLERVGSDNLIIFDDWDVAAYVYLKMGHQLQDIAIASVNVIPDIPEMTISQLEPLMALAKESKQIVLVWDVNGYEEAKWLASWLKPSETKWARFAFPPRKMFKQYHMTAAQLKRAVTTGAEKLR